jgi:DNA repair exonuclease SbcCD ATPase subunit
MKIKSINLTNFGSYRELHLNLDNKGLVLIHGATGAGKSTVMDGIAWTLTGQTAKNGSADDIRPWGCDEPTRGEVVVISKYSKLLKIVRIRGSKNDLFVEIDGEAGQVIRGKDLQDTQSIISGLLGVDCDLFFIASYCSDFSPTNSFFRDPASKRRDLFKKIADSSVPDLLQKKSSERLSKVKKESAELTSKVKYLEGKLDNSRQSMASLREAEAKWTREQEALKVNFDKIKESNIKALETKVDVQTRLLEEAAAASDKLAAQLQALEGAENQLITAKNTPPCEHCGGPTAKSFKLIEKAQEAVNRKMRLQAKYDLALSRIGSITNVLEELYSQVDGAHAASAETIEYASPYVSNINAGSIQIQDLTAEHKKEAARLNALKQTESCLNQLYDISSIVRSAILKTAISQVQRKVNDILNVFFDGAFTVYFSDGEADSLSVEVFVQNHECSYSQLSKGQRRLLNLCFSVAVMEVASNNAGVKFENLFFDEALDGLDADYKHKSLSLFQALGRDSAVCIIEHSTGFKIHCDAAIEAVKEGDYSELLQS